MTCWPPASGLVRHRPQRAYGRFKELLGRKGRLQAWYDYETNATELALRKWGAEQGLSIVEGPAQNAG